MATKTSILGLIKPAFNEFKNSWWGPLNNNFDLIDESVGATQLEVENARGSASTLADRLAISVNLDGSLAPIPENVRAYESSVYGSAAISNPPSTVDTLRARLEAGDREVFVARQGLTALVDTLSFVGNDDVPNSIQSAPSGYITTTGATVYVNGSVTPVVCNINGRRAVVRTQKSITMTGSSPAATYYLKLSLQTNGDPLVSDTTNASDGVSTYGVDSKLRMFTDTTKDFSSTGYEVKPGDYLEITSAGSLNKDKYIVSDTWDTNPYDSMSNPTGLKKWQVAVLGQFSTAQTLLAYAISNPLAPALSFTATPPPPRYDSTLYPALFSGGYIYIGQFAWDGSSIANGEKIYALKGRYEEWQSFTADATALFSPNLGFIPRKLEVFASTAADYSVAVEPLSIAEVSAGSQTLRRSVIVDITTTLIRVKNATTGLLYADFGGTPHASGQLLVRAER